MMNHFFLWVSLLLTLTPSAATALSPPPEQLVETGKRHYEAGSLSEAMTALEEAILMWENRSNVSALAITLTNLGRVQLAAGEPEKALKTWEKSIQIYQTQIPNQTAITRLQIYRSEAFQNMGLYNQACVSIISALAVSPQLCQQPEISPTTVTPQNTLDISAWQTLAEIFRKTGKLEASRLVLLNLQQPASNTPQHAQIALSLGNTHKAIVQQQQERNAPTQYQALPWRCRVTPLPDAAQTDYQNALQNYQIAAQSSDSTLRTQAQLNGLALVASSGETPDQYSFLSENIDVTALPPGRSQVYGRILLAKTQACLSQNQSLEWSQLESEINQAIQQAQAIGDTRAEAEAVGNLGSLYEYQNSWLEDNQLLEKALKLTDQALLLAQSVQATDSVYQWYWQRGRLLRALGRKTEAIQSLETALKTLEKVRKDLVSVDSQVQLSFRDQVEPLYRELVGLLLNSIDESSSSQTVQDILTRSLFYVESLQRVELENFLQCELESITAPSVSESAQALNQRIESIFQNDSETAFIYPILLEAQVAVIVKQPDQTFRYHLTPVKGEAVEAVVNQLQTYLRTDPSRRNDIRELSHQLYQWLIAPFATELEVGVGRENSNVKRLTFVLDSGLRNVPMSVLFDFDREQYLLERYAISIAPSLNLLDSEQPTRELSALVGGLSEQREFNGQLFSPLSNVPEELASIASFLESKKLLNETFVRPQIEQALETNPYSVLHIATHGNFSSNPNDTFILLADETLQAQEFNILLSQNNEQPTLELLVLSACETATGDRRAALGLAGIALRGGAKSTLATLWQVDDESTAAVMKEFYRQLKLNPSQPKVEALRKAQLTLWETNPEWELPFFWSSYVLVGNWL